MFCELYRKTTISLATHMQTHRRTISSGRIQTYRIKTICLLLSPPATRTHVACGYLVGCARASAFSSRMLRPAESGECTHPQFVCTIRWRIPAFGRFRSFSRHLSERDNSYSVQCANVGRLLATFLSPAFSSCCRAASRAPTAIITGGLFGGV